MLNPTPPEKLVDAEGHPYFLWDTDMTLEEFREGLRSPDPDVRAYLIGKLMRQAKPDDVFTFVSARQIRELWPRLERYLGKTREFWTWLFEEWEARTTKDLDLFWHERQQLGSLPRETQARLTAEGLEVAIVQTSPTFHRLRVTDGPEVCIVDLVAEPVPAIHRAQAVEIQGVSITVDTPQEILVNKLCTLLSRSEVRDLIDVRALLESGADLEEALADAPRKDAGFSPLVLAWVLRDLRPRSLAGAAGLSETEAEDLDRFREKLISGLLEAGHPQ